MNPRVFSYGMRYYLFHPWKVVSELFDQLDYFIQRGRRGWAICDAWHADSYIAEVISELCTYIAERSTGTPYPFFEQEDGDKAYIAYLQELATAFGNYADFMGNPDAWPMDMGNVRYAQMIEKMKPLFDHYSTISD